MDQNKKHSIQNIGKFSQVHFLKKIIKILVLISVFSLLFSQPSLVAGLLNYFDYYVSPLSVKFFDNKTERKYIFLLCNGILALIIKNSGLMTNYQGNSSLNDTKTEKNQRSSDAEVKINTEINEDGEKEDENDDKIPADYQIPGCEEEEEEEEEEETELPSAEELNRKCDDFIKKTREDQKRERSSGY